MHVFHILPSHNLQELASFLVRVVSSRLSIACIVAAVSDCKVVSLPVGPHAAEDAAGREAQNKVCFVRTFHVRATSSRPRVQSDKYYLPWQT